VRASLTVTSRQVGGRRKLQDDSTWGERTQSFPCIIRCETVTFRLLWVVNVFSYTIHAQTDCWSSCFPLALSIFFSPLTVTFAKLAVILRPLYNLNINHNINFTALWIYACLLQRGSGENSSTTCNTPQLSGSLGALAALYVKWIDWMM
jgi:hypothetical protein